MATSFHESSPASPSTAIHSTEKQWKFFSGGMILVCLIALFKLAMHCVLNNRYGYFRDEFDYLACGRHLAWGYVDQPPLVPFLTRLSEVLLGDSLRSIRFVPALAISLTVVLTGMIARHMGGKRFALLLSAVAMLIAPMYLSDGSLLGTNCLEPLLWMGCAYFVLLALKTMDSRYWLGFGVIAGLGMEEKYSIAIFCFALLAGVAISARRRILLSRWLLLGGLLAFLLFLPNLLWNVHYHWPFLELMHNIRASGRDVHLSAGQYLVQQILLLHPFSFPLWAAGVVALLLWPRLRTYQALGWSYLIALSLFIVLKGKNYYLAPVYPMLLAAGAVALESTIGRLKWLQTVVVILLLAGGALLSPIILPVLPIEGFLRYQANLPFALPRSEHSHASAALPQHYADQFGWEELVEVVHQGWSGIPAEERSDCGIFAQNYGEAGAIDFFGPRYGLPAALSGHQSYYLWGPRSYSGNCLLVVGDRRERLSQLFEQVTYIGSSDNPYALERHIPVFLCRRAKFGTLAAIWPKLKSWD